ncbi:MAG: hypothetical protein AAF725_04910 [Acidobacteriota bacterium]
MNDTVSWYLDSLANSVWGLSEFFMAFPLLPLAIAAALLSNLFRKRLSIVRRALVALSGGFWLIYSLYESATFTYCALTETYPIRNDMLLLGPILVAAALLGFLASWTKTRSAIPQDAEA